MVAIGGGRVQIFLATGITDLWRGFGLQSVIEHGLGRPPLNGDIYLFANRRRDMIKAFFFGSSGLGPLGFRLVCALRGGFGVAGTTGAGSSFGSANSFCCPLSSGR